MNKQTFATHLSIEVRELEIWLEQDWLVPARDGGELRFHDVDVARGRLIRELKGGFGVNDPGVDLVLHLLDQLHGARRAFEALGRDLHGPEPGKR